MQIRYDFLLKKIGSSDTLGQKIKNEQKGNEQAEQPHCQCLAKFLYGISVLAVMVCRHSQLY